MPEPTVLQLLSAPFPAKDIRYKPQAVSGNRALAVFYLDARAIQDRLDDVLGIEGWQDEYECLADGSVVCRLRVKVGDEWITKMDVGSQSEQPDGGDRMKSAFSDALKRAAVKFGIGRYLYRAPPQWCDYDVQKRAFTKTPTLPASHLPKGGGSPPADKPRPASPAPPAAKAVVPRATQESIDEIDKLMGQLKLGAKWMHDALMEKFGKEEVADLTVEEAAKVRTGLEAEVLNRARKAAEKNGAASPETPAAQPPDGKAVAAKKKSW